jgi:hypothetical protein
MRLKLKENPREWRKFTLVWSLAACLLYFLAYRRGHPFSPKFLYAVAAFFLVGMFLPVAMRLPYRLIMTASFQVGKVLGKVLLSVFFLVILTPLALLLRAAGKDLLQVKKTSRDSYWEKATAESAHDRMF